MLTNMHQPRPYAPLTRSRLPIGNYGWLIGGLAPCRRRSDNELRAIAAAMTTKGGEHPTLPAGYTYFGQLVDHDLSFQSVTAGQRISDPDSLHNFRTPRLDLDCLYARGPQDQPYLYRRDDPVKLLNGRANGYFDLPRNAFEQALVGDPRNDEQMLVAHFHLALIQFHNQVVEELRSGGDDGPGVFEDARRLVTWHYQWVVLHDYLPKILQQGVLDRLHEVARGGRRAWRGLRYFVPSSNPYLPLEFVGAAYRYGHSMVRESYLLNSALDTAREHKPIQPFAEDGDDLRGGRVPPTGWFVDPELFVDFGKATYQRALLIDTRLSAALARVPVGSGFESLAYLDLAKGQNLGLPSGEAMAKAMGMRHVLSPTEVGLGGVKHETPLWYYILKEAEVQEQGERLGELGSSIVGEVFVGLLLMDPASFVAQQPSWEPSLDRKGDFSLGDLVRYAFLGSRA